MQMTLIGSLTAFGKDQPLRCLWEHSHNAMLDFLCQQMTETGVALVIIVISLIKY